MLGVSIGPETVADRTLALPVNVDAGGGRRQVVGQPLFTAAPPALMSKTDVITADLSRPINFGAPGHLITKPPTGVTFTPLVETTAQAALISSAIAKSDPTPRAVLEAYASSDRPDSGRPPFRRTSLVVLAAATSATAGRSRSGRSGAAGDGKSAALCLPFD